MILRIYLFYVGVFAGAALLLQLATDKSMVLKMVAAIIPIIVAALRDNVGTDYATYVKGIRGLSNVVDRRFL